MARRRTRRSTTRTTRRSTGRSYSSGRRRTSGRRSVSTRRGSARTIRIEVVQAPAAGPAVNPVTGQLTAATAAPRRAMF